MKKQPTKSAAGARLKKGKVREMAGPAKAGTTILKPKSRSGLKPELRTKKPESRKGAGKPPVLGPESPLENGQWERFCLLMAEGRYSGKSCYAQCYPGSGEEAARRSASDLLTNPDIRGRIEWLKGEAVKAFTCEKAEIMRLLYHAAVTPVGYVDEESPLAQEVTWEEHSAGGAQGQLMRGKAESGNEVEDGPPVVIVKRKVKMMGKNEAAKLLAQMQGWEKPKEVVLNLGYEPPGKALERALEKGIDVGAILRRVGLLTEQ